MVKIDHIFQHKTADENTEFGVRYHELNVNGETITLYIYKENDDRFVDEVLLSKGDEVIPFILSNLREPNNFSNCFVRKESSEIECDFTEYLEQFIPKGERTVYYLNTEEWTDVLEHFDIIPSEKNKLIHYTFLNADNFGWGSKIQIIDHCSYRGLEFTNAFFLDNFGSMYIADTISDIPLHKLIKLEYLNPEAQINGESRWIFPQE